MIATTIEQGKRLLACGIKAETADMSYQIGMSETYGEYDWGMAELSAIPYDDLVAYICERKEPAWSLSTLLTEVLPKSINKQLESELELGVFENEWYCKYCYSATEVWAKDPIEACVLMVELLHEKKMLK